MSNTLAAIMATATDAAQIVSKEPTGFIDAIDFRGDLVGATLNSTVNLGLVGAPTERAWTAGITPTLTDSAEESVSLTLTQAYEEVFHLTGEQIQGLSMGNFNAQKYVQLKFAQCYRALRNKIEGYIALKAKAGAHRAIGTAGTTPFASNLDVTATLRRNLEQNGAPVDDGGVSLVIDTFAAENVRKLLGSPVVAAGALATVNQQPGSLPRHNGMQMRVSPQIAVHTKGDGASYTGTAAAKATGVTLASGTGAILAGDVLSFAAATSLYVAAKGASTNALIAGLINRPGLRAALSTAALTIGNDYTPNIALHRNALVAVVRPPAQVPLELGNGAPRPFLADVIQDPANGMPYGLYVQLFDGGVHFSVRAIYDAVAVNTDHIMTLMG